VKDDPESIEVGRSVRPLRAGDLLRGHVREGPEEGSGEGRTEVREVGHTEVADLHVAGFTKEDVRRLEVPVNDTAAVDRFETGEHRRHHVADDWEGEHAALPARKAVFEGAPGDVLHNEERTVGVELEDANDVWVVEPRRDPSLPGETGIGIAPRRTAAHGEHLHRDLTLVESIVGEHHAPRRAGAEGPNDSVPTGEQAVFPLLSAGDPRDATLVAKALLEVLGHRHRQGRVGAAQFVEAARCSFVEAEGREAGNQEPRRGTTPSFVGGSGLEGAHRVLVAPEVGEDVAEAQRSFGVVRGFAGAALIKQPRIAVATLGFAAAGRVCEVSRALEEFGGQGDLRGGLHQARRVAIAPFVLCELGGGAGLVRVVGEGVDELGGETALLPSEGMAVRHVEAPGILGEGSCRRVVPGIGKERRRNNRSAVVLRDVGGLAILTFAAEGGDPVLDVLGQGHGALNKKAPRRRPEAAARRRRAEPTGRP